MGEFFYFVNPAVFFFRHPFRLAPVDLFLKSLQDFYCYLILSSHRFEICRNGSLSLEIEPFNSYDSNHGCITFYPPERESGDGKAFTGNLINISSHVLNAGNIVAK